ncbi:hypothetical protein NEMBOFW57_007052 [Staphylotrichum longicolle]|uniref:Rhodanese domain-containing protein n=1 Tax=Staphylotrichum longicolle TaxID=669026 RepID=A0AAD4EUT3_9PEZI|nr:hypothetical protein NEMBOFW57_007052 [Staphylotrichum longicolle]
MATIGTLERVTAASLSKILLAQNAAAAGDPTVAIIDVRDDDHIGGHIKGSQNVPSRTLDAMLPTLETVVFHCALSQQRGPAAALRYIRERDRLLAARKAVDKGDAAGEEGKEGKEIGEESQPAKTQKVYVLDRGFVGWQEVYGTDERLTEGYRKELWEDGYWG